MNDEGVVAVVGLGYVGLPLAVAFGRLGRTIGYDRSRGRVDALARGEDGNGEIDAAGLRAATRLEVTSDEAALAQADILIVAVPTPVDAEKRPDMRALVDASAAVGRQMRRGATVIFESTVYPGATAQVCVPALEQASGMTWKKDFFVGYSPERINPGDREHVLERIVKVVSGDSAETLERVAALYARVVTAGVHRAPSIETAEAAKVIENTQRDLNIALMNELAMIFDRLGLDTGAVLEAAATKWNFLKFTPGLVGGHCIGVDPYYLTHRAQEVGYEPQVILAGRRINDGMARFVADKTASMIEAAGRPVQGAVVNLLGITFKEDVRDLRNSQAAVLYAELVARGLVVHVHDPVVSADAAREEYGIGLECWETLPQADALVVAVAHRTFHERAMTDWLGKLAPGGAVIDVMGALDLGAFRATGYIGWRL